MVPRAVIVGNEEVQQAVVVIVCPGPTLGSAGPYIRRDRVREYASEGAIAVIVIRAATAATMGRCRGGEGNEDDGVSHVATASAVRSSSRYESVTVCSFCLVAELGRPSSQSATELLQRLGWGGFG